MDTYSYQRKELIQFFVMAFLIGWLVWIPILLDHLDILNLGLDQSLVPLGFLGPILSATILTLRTAGKRGLAELFRGLVLFKVNRKWYLAMLLPALLTTLTHLIFVAFFEYDEFNGLTNILIGYVFITVFLILEEVGWRGYALPRLQKRYSAFNSSLILGSIWAVWHFPFWTIIPIEGAPEPFYIFYFTGSIGAICMSIFITWIYNNTRGSIALCTLCHASFNATIGAITFSKGDAIYHNLLFVVLGVVAAATIVIKYGKTNLKRDRKET